MRQSLIDHLTNFCSADRGGTGFSELDDYEAGQVADEFVNWVRDNANRVVPEAGQGDNMEFAHLQTGELADLLEAP